MTEIDLVRMRRMIREIERLKWKIEKEQAYATRSSAALSELPWGRGNRSRVEEGAIRLVELKEAYKEIIGKLAEMRKELDPLISTLDNADDRAVMRLRYINGYRPEAISDAICMTDRMVYYILRRAEDALARRYPQKFQ